MVSLVLTTLFLLGAIIASFIGVVAGRLSTGESILTGRSRCDACGKVLDPLALVPILSFTAQRARALCCGTRLSLLDPLYEALLGALFVITYLQFGSTPHTGFLLIALSLLLLLVRYDLAHQILPPLPLGVFIGGGALVALSAAVTREALLYTVLTSVGLSAVLGVIYVGSRGRALGFSDIPLVFGLGLLTGPAAVPGFIFSFWIGALVGIVILARRPKGSRMMVEVPFAPFLSAGFLLALFTQWNPFTIVAAIL